MNLILEQTDQVKYFTYLPQVFTAMKIDCKDYDWYVSDVETNGFEVREGWYTGAELSQLIDANHIQFIWGVFSAVKQGERPKIVDAPYAYDNQTYWHSSNLRPQLPGALFEIVSWDSGATILIGLSGELAGNFTSVYSDAKELTNAAN